MQSKIHWLQDISFKLLAMLFCSLFLLGQVQPALAEGVTAPHSLAPIFHTYNQPVAVSWNNPRKVHIFALASDGAVWQKTLDGTTLKWGAWQNLGNPNSYTYYHNISAISWAPGRIDLFTSDNATGVYHKSLVNTTWSAWEYLGNPGASMSAGIVVTSWGAGRLDIFTKQMGGTYGSPLYHKWYDSGIGWGPSQTAWEDVQDARSVEITAISRFSNSFELYGYNLTTGYILHRWQTNGVWGPADPGWESLSGQTRRPPLVLSWASDRLDVFVRGYNPSGEAKPVVLRSWTGTGGWFGWNSIGGNSNGAVTGVSWGATRLDVFEVRRNGDSADGVYHKAWAGTAWVPSSTNWEYIGGQRELSDIAVASWGPNRLDLFAVRDTDGSLWHLAWNGSTWTPCACLWELLN